MNGGHPLDGLSAMLDGELSAEEDAAVRGHLDGCEDCRRQLWAIGEARSALRSLAPVDPPTGWTEGFVRRLRRILVVVATGAAAVAAGAVGAMWATAPVREVTPTADLLSQVSPSPSPSPPAAGAGAPTAGSLPGGSLPGGSLPGGYVAPDRLGGLLRVDVSRRHGTLRVLYRAGVRQVALVEEDGRLDSAWAGSRPGPAAGSPWPSGYRWAGGDAFTWQAGPAVMTLVGDPASVAEAAASLPAPGGAETVGARLRRVCREVLEDLSGSD